MRLLAQKLSQEESNFIQIRKDEQPHENCQICYRYSHRPRVNRRVMKKKILSLAAGIAALLFASSSIASSNPIISSSSENSVRMSDARVARALGGGSYVTGMIEPSFGYVAPGAVHVHVAAYDANGKLLAEKVDQINANDLVISHLRPSPRAPYAVFFPWEPSQIAKVTVGIE
jgi:hypothetical protein